jgi:hypothetical protein
MDVFRCFSLTASAPLSSIFGRLLRGGVDGGAEFAAGVRREEVRLEEQPEASEERWIHGLRG